MNVPSKRLISTIAFVSLSLSSCVFDDFLDERRQQALRAEFRALGEKCARVNIPYPETSKCIVAAGYTLKAGYAPALGQSMTSVRRCVGESCGWINITVERNGNVLRWEVGSSGKPGLPSNALN